MEQATAGAATSLLAGLGIVGIGIILIAAMAFRWLRASKSLREVEESVITRLAADKDRPVTELRATEARFNRSIHPRASSVAISHNRGAAIRVVGADLIEHTEQKAGAVSAGTCCPDAGSTSSPTRTDSLELRGPQGTRSKHWARKG